MKRHLAAGRMGIPRQSMWERLNLRQVESTVKSAARFFIFTVILFIGGCAGTSPVRNSPQASAIPAGQRIAILVTGEERELMLNEMRFFLDMLYVSTDALSRGDMATVALAARKRGTAEMAREPHGLYEKLMPAYRNSIEETRKHIDQLARRCGKSECAASDNQALQPDPVRM